MSLGLPGARSTGLAERCFLRELYSACWPESRWISGPRPQWKSRDNTACRSVGGKGAGKGPGDSRSGPPSYQGHSDVSVSTGFPGQKSSFCVRWTRRVAFPQLPRKFGVSRERKCGKHQTSLVPPHPRSPRGPTEPPVSETPLLPTHAGGGRTLPCPVFPGSLGWGVLDSHSHRMAAGA